MRFLKIDWTSEPVIFMFGMFFLLLLITGLLGRVSARGRGGRRRQAKRRRLAAKRARANDPNDERDIIV